MIMCFIYGTLRERSNSFALTKRRGQSSWLPRKSSSKKSCCISSPSVACQGPQQGVARLTTSCSGGASASFKGVLETVWRRQTFCSQFVLLRQHHLNTEHNDNFSDHSDTRRPPRPGRCHSNPLPCHRCHWWSIKQLSPGASSLVLHFFSFPRAALIKGAVRSPARKAAHQQVGTKGAGGFRLSVGRIINPIS